MGTAARQFNMADWRFAPAWLLAAALPLTTAFLCASWHVWAQAWALAASVYAALKWLTFQLAPAAQRASVWQSLDYLLLWPGMDAQAFLSRQVHEVPTVWEWLCAAGKFAVGVAMICFAVPLGSRFGSLWAAAGGLVGLALVSLFGLGHFLSLWWRRMGVDARPIMNRPLAARSLGDFWSNRWNLAFRDAARAVLFQPLAARCGVTKATMAIFLFSGIVHDLVMSLPARVGLGLPTLYFVIQGLGVLFERSRAGLRLGLGQGVRGRAFAAAVILLPLGLLFHRGFLERVILPTLQALGALTA